MELTQDKIIFEGLDATNQAHQYLAYLIVNFASKATKVQDKVIQPENEKFAFRVWLVRMGWKGTEGKKERQSLYRNLTGNSAFCTSESKDRWEAKWAKKKA